jgi:uncharacterized protein YkwD
MGFIKFWSSIIGGLALFCAAVYLVTDIFLPSLGYAPVLSSVITDELDADVLFNQVNEYRISKGLNPTEVDNRLCAIAQARIPEVRKDWSHKGFEEKYSLYSELLNYRNIGENLGNRSLFYSDVFNDWTDSPSHEANMVGDYTHSCVVTDGDYAVHIFASYHN